LVDSSCSMRETFAGGGSEKRIEAARRLISGFVSDVYNEVNNPTVAAIAFSNDTPDLTAGLFVGPDGKDDVINALANLTTGQGGCATKSYNAMQKGRMLMRDRNKAKVSIIVYDGAPTGGKRGVDLHQQECDAIKREGSILYSLF